jgi:chromosome segregation protein
VSEGRLKALRMVGFKSFAERTVVEFGPGISAIIGPNGSGKSNLADALRWALGEQGRTLRTRRAEDLIFAGSSSRRAIGMADVTLVIDNRDRLLPVDYAEVELGRRLFRSGENEYLLNRQKVRLRDLVDLLDEANLADNAFLFIGQGMVDQALALRPEERRPLFEEAAGIRKHERRCRAAEAELTEAEGNVERVRDVLAELRPQARRLAAQAEQQEQRRSAGSDLAEALVAFGRARLVGAEQEADRHRGLNAAARAEADAALAALRDAEEDARGLTTGLTERAEAERGMRGRLDAARSTTLEQRLAEARIATESQSMVRERARLDAERVTLAGRVADARRAAAVPLPDVDGAAEGALRDAERALDDAVHELDAARAGGAVEDERRARWLAGRRAQQEELSRAQRRREELASRLLEQDRTAATAEAHLAAEQGSAAKSATDSREAADAEHAAEAHAELARGAAAAAEAAHAEVAAQQASAVAELAGLDARIGALEAALAAAVDQEAYRAARRRGGAFVAEGLDVEADLRPAVEAALGDALRGLAVDQDAALALRDRRATLLLPEAGGRGTRTPERDTARIEAAVAAVGGRPLVSAIRRDPAGHVTRLLGRTFCVENLETALALRAQLPAGWRLATLDGEIVTDEGLVRVGQAPSHLKQQAELQARASDRVRTAEGLASLVAAVGQAAAQRAASARALDEARRSLESARRARRVAEEQERARGRTSEAAAREAAWQSAVLDRLREQLAGAEADLARVEAAVAAERADEAGGPNATPIAGSAADLKALEERVAAARTVRDQRAAALNAQTRRRADADELRRRAEIGAAMDERRLAEVEAERTGIAGSEADLGTQRERVVASLAAATAEEQAIGRQLDALLDAGRDERSRLAAAEAAAAAARERLRSAETRGRTAEVAEMEARLHADSARESLLVELAGIGLDGLAALRQVRDDDAETPPGQGTGSPAAESAATLISSAEELGPALESALEACLSTWRAEPASAPEPPGTGRLASLRRRYHELGASNPFAAQEYAVIRDRLETLDAQRHDLESAIHSTRELIGNLNSLIAEQFRRTFAQLEGAFARRFTQLFDGGEAQLSLTVPEDLSTTGVEIIARPPGKKRQPLAMLSGGERTLTAVALLLAMLEVRPVPFCVLDEVDAALDEANVGRFSAALRDLAETIQFVVITHNRGTIEAADALYGVTVGDDAVSRVVSMRLDGRNPRNDRNGSTAAVAIEPDVVAVGPAG